MVVNLKANEIVLKAGDTNHCCENDRIPGKLIVTNQRIYFYTKNPNASNFNLEILPDQIKEVIFYNTNKIFPNGLNLILKAGQQLKFILKKRNAFGELINKMY
ncbi:MAG: hypothetical protein JSV24_11995 [Bacteroidales bacterium]|nr:MAG: hypothetical protein JSV24_11995 [Bacteroidales bacterium]